MKHKRRTKRALINSVISLLICFSMLLGTTFAWFTDEVVSGMNTISAGNLDVELYHSNAAVSNERVDSTTKLFLDLQGDTILWEPGVVSYENLSIANEGDLALAYQMAINTANENFVMEDNTARYGLSQILKVGVVPNGITATDRASVVASVDAANWTTLENFLYSGNLLPEGVGESETVLGVVIYWEAGENDNRWNLNNGKTLNEGDVLSIDLGIELVATQKDNEADSFNEEYDKNAPAELFSGFQGGIANAIVSADDRSLTTAEVAIAGGDVSAVIPEGVKIADETTSLKLSVDLKEVSEANIQLNENEEMRPLDVHIEGVAEDNDTPMLITLKHYLSAGINTGALRMYHVENGATVAMTQVTNPVNHNEFSYDPLTGDVTLALASFSEVAVVADTNNPWDGTTETAYTGNGTEADPYLIANADQLAYFRTQVDNGNSFEGKFVKLNNNIYLSNQNFDPIGWGYKNAAHNRKDVAGNNMSGKVFMGTFDGNGKTIFDLYQSGWDLEETNGIDYTYTNCGFGLFAAASGATFKDLTINGAFVRVECVEAGVLVGLSQNSCTYNNIEIHNAKIANYQRPAGGLIGEVSGEGTTTITGVTIGSDVVVGSLWGDFDAPCGGVIGARWDDAGEDPQIKMTNVEVGCRMDVYSDVTSAYQWYAYRRAGMLIGNTELTAENNEHLAAAPFLTCENVKIYYGDWAAYHYCQFTNQDDSWCNNYPWVRVEAGENCSAYSNPRYGQPVIGGVTVSSDNHNCTGEHLMELRFNQLYGGGQGVYGQPKHDGVEIVNYRYSITYVNDYQVLAIKYVTETGAVSTANGAAQDLVEKWASANITGTWNFGGWMNAGSTKVETIPAGNTNNIVLYPYFNKPYTARFVDQQGNVIAWCFFHAEDTSKLEPTRAIAEAALPDLGEQLKFDYWEVQRTNNEGNVISKVEYNKDAFADYEQDVTIYPVYKYEGDVKLIPVDTDSDGIINYYQVAGYSNPNGQALVKIPDSVNGIPVTEINGGAFSSYDGVHSIIIPKDVTNIGNNAFAEKWGIGDGGETITIYYAGSYADWLKIEPSFGSNWESGISESSRIFFLNGGNTVDVSQGYLQAKLNGYTQNNKNISWTPASISSSIIVEYTGYCDCSISTTGDTAHTYVDASGNVMKHNDDGTPINSNGIVIEYKRKNIFSNYKLTTDDDDTYYRYRPDKAYWEGVTAE